MVIEWLQCGRCHAANTREEAEDAPVRYAVVLHVLMSQAEMDLWP
jgi:hypothetical protein